MWNLKRGLSAIEQKEKLKQQIQENSDELMKDLEFFSKFSSKKRHKKLKEDSKFENYNSVSPILTKIKLETLTAVAKDKVPDATLSLQCFNELQNLSEQEQQNNVFLSSAPEESTSLDDLTLRDTALKQYFEQQHKFFRQIYEQQFAVAAASTIFFDQQDHKQRKHGSNNNKNKWHSNFAEKNLPKMSINTSQPQFRKNINGNRKSSFQNNNGNKNYRSTKYNAGNNNHKQLFNGRFYETAAETSMIAHQHLGLPPRIPPPATFYFLESAECFHVTSSGCFLMDYFAGFEPMYSWTGEYGLFLDESDYKLFKHDKEAAMQQQLISRLKMTTTKQQQSIKNEKFCKRVIYKENEANCNCETNQW